MNLENKTKSYAKLEQENKMLTEEIKSLKGWAKKERELIERIINKYEKTQTKNKLLTNLIQDIVNQLFELEQERKKLEELIKNRH